MARAKQLRKLFLIFVGITATGIILFTDNNVSAVALGFLREFVPRLKSNVLLKTAASAGLLDDEYIKKLSNKASSIYRRSVAKTSKTLLLDRLRSELKQELNRLSSPSSQQGLSLHCGGRNESEFFFRQARQNLFEKSLMNN